MRLSVKLVFPIMLGLFLWGSLPASAEIRTVRVSTSYRNLLSDAESAGMLDQIVKEAFKRINIKAEIVFTNTRRSLVTVNNGELDAEINRVAGMEQTYTNLVRVPEPNMQMQFVAFARKKISISGWESLRKLRIGMVQGWKILEQHTREFPHVTHLTEISTLFEMLERDRIDVVLYSKLTGCEELHKLDFDDIHPLSPPLATRDMFLYLHKSHERLAVPLAEALREMKKDGTYARIVERTTCHLH
ncbi:transporter substrate-binding domain-containing protein [uncultured Pseudodesulfovibrio sp.]|uniref:substrate-binding periplasmic protein n=1 Tax=uncultured Pseudodesulfovibrio sp. TaxID=2035858 RepID=UPI0029C73F94|nr:transporter substrate-binding domain-containing protein [uncultured Pseudodesulfovibrio sp.]